MIRKCFNYDVRIRVATINDAEEIYNLMQEVYDTLDDKSTYVYGDLNSIKKRINCTGFALVAECDGKIIGSFIFNYPGKSSGNYGIDINLPEEELDKVVIAENVAVHPKYRGNNLQYYMLCFAEKMIDKKKYKYFLSTVSPINKASKRSFEKNGYINKKTVIKYGGLERNIYYKYNN